MKKVISFALALIMVTSSAFAVTQSDVDKANKDVKDIQSQIQAKENEKKDLVKEIDDLGEAIHTTEIQIDSIENEIADLEDSIKNTEENIKFSEEQYNQKYELRKKRMNAYYKTGNMSFDDLLEDVEDDKTKMCLERVLSKVVEYDTNLMNEIDEEKQYLEQQKQGLEEDTKRCKDLKNDLDIQLANYEDKKEIRTQYQAQLDKDLDALEITEDKMIEEANRLEKELAALASKNGTSTASKGKMTWPLPGAYIITSPFGNRLHPVLKVYKLHTGVDIAGSGCNGKPVVAAASGTVIKATYSTAYGNYIVIDHGGGITTLYAHSSKLEVKAGDYVTAGQEIMKVGTTGYSTGPHLHFEVRVNGVYKDPIGEGWIKH